MRHTIKQEGKPFINKDAAVMAFQAAQVYFIQAGFLTTSYVSLQNASIELTVHFDLPNMPKLPIGYNWSHKELSSNAYYSEADKAPDYVRCLTLRYKY